MSLKIIESGIKDVQFGQNVTILSPVNIYGCTVGYDTFIGNDCFIGHGVMFINDLFMKGGLSKVIKLYGQVLMLEIMFLLVQMQLFCQLLYLIM